MEDFQVNGRLILAIRISYSSAEDLSKKSHLEVTKIFSISSYIEYMQF